MLAGRQRFGEGFLNNQVTPSELASRSQAISNSYCAPLQKGAPLRACMPPLLKHLQYFLKKSWTNKFLANYPELLAITLILLHWSTFYVPLLCAFVPLQLALL